MILNVETHTILLSYLGYLHNGPHLEHLAAK
jgi:hypothetical protein